MLYTSYCNRRTGISNGFDFVNVKVVDDGIKAGVQIVEQVYHLEGSATTSNLGESNNVTGRGGRGRGD